MGSAKELSIVIPTLNEESNITALFSSIALQEEVEFEVIVADGDSRDRTIQAVGEAQPSASIIPAKRGRASQLNAGAAVARGEFILFLHADSVFTDTLALRRSLDFLKRSSLQSHGNPCAGHFSVRFRTGNGNSSLAYRVLESKAALNRKGCSHGDQGILVPSELFSRYEGFAESCQILAETRFADRLRENGHWLLLPAELSTSARRFEKEGMLQRQSLNAVIMALGGAGFDDFLNTTILYAEDGQSSKLRLEPVLHKVDRLISSFDKSGKEEFWRTIGKYICENAWQLPLWADVMLGDTAACRKIRLLELYDRHLGGLAENRGAARLAACAARLWLAVMTFGKQTT